jgi:hypothetical protein
VNVVSGLGQQTSTAGICRGMIRTVLGTGRLIVERSDGGNLLCEVLATVDLDLLTLGEGDTVLCWVPSTEQEEAVVLGRLQRSEGAAGDQLKSRLSIPDALVLEARKSLTLRVGDGSITIREDGKILIKGKDLVSHAKRMNRIRGGSVAIN